MITYCTHKNCHFCSAVPCSPVTKIAVSTFLMIVHEFDWILCITMITSRADVMVAGYFQPSVLMHSEGYCTGFVFANNTLIYINIASYSHQIFLHYQCFLIHLFTFVISVHYYCIIFVTVHAKIKHKSAKYFLELAMDYTPNEPL